jgi:hypothetical protein
MRLLVMADDDNQSLDERSNRFSDPYSWRGAIMRELDDMRAVYKLLSGGDSP